MTDTLTFFHAPQSRSSGIAILLEELRAPHELRLVNLKGGEQRQPAFQAVNPMGKVPAILKDGVLVTEQVAITIYLADLFPEADLTPGLRDADRGSYLRWLAFYGSCFEPAVVDHALKREPAPLHMSPYGTFERMFDTLCARLEESPFIAGARMTAADVLWGSALSWVTSFKLVPERPAITQYVENFRQRPSFIKVMAADAAAVSQ